MSKQKFVVFLIAIIGMIATFLPWYESAVYFVCIIGFCAVPEVAAVIANKNDTPKNLKFLIFFYLKWLFGY